MHAVRFRRPAVRWSVALVAAVLCPALPSALHAQSDTSFTLQRNAIVDLTVRSGIVVVRGGSGSTGELRTSSSRYELRSTGVGITLSARESGSRAYTRDTEDSRVELTVPRGVRLVIDAGSADVEVRDIEGDVEVQTRSGDVRLQGLGQRAIVETLSGDIILEGGVAVARIATASGDVTVRGVRSEADIRTTSGDVTVETSGASRVAAQSISGDVELDGALASDAQLRVATHSGDVVMRLDESIRGTLEFETHNGELTATSSLLLLAPQRTGTRADTRPRQRFEFGGGGGASLTVSTFNGDLRFVRGARRSSDD